jgi:hypothetical protein
LPANHGFYFDGTGPGNPNVTLLFNAGSTAGVSFDVSLLGDLIALRSLQRGGSDQHGGDDIAAAAAAASPGRRERS